MHIHSFLAYNRSGMCRCQGKKSSPGVRGIFLQIPKNVAQALGLKRFIAFLPGVFGVKWHTVFWSYFSMTPRG
jgi:hypothetical protein